MCSHIKVLITGFTRSSRKKCTVRAIVVINPGNPTGQVVANILGFFWNTSVISALTAQRSLQYNWPHPSLLFSHLFRSASPYFSCWALPSDGVRGIPSVGWSVGRSVVAWLVVRSVCHNFLKMAASFTSMLLAEDLFELQIGIVSGVDSREYWEYHQVCTQRKGKPAENLTNQWLFFDEILTY